MIERTSNVPTGWDEEADVVVCGSGGAALSCAVVSAIEGCSVTVLEKADLVGGTTAVSGGGVWIPNNHCMPAVGTSDSREESMAYLQALVGDTGEQAMLDALVDEGPKAVRYLEDKGGFFWRAYPAVGGTSDYRPWLPGEKPGSRSMDCGWFELESLGVSVKQLRKRGTSTADKFDMYTQRRHAAAPDGTHDTHLAPGQSDAVTGTVIGGAAFAGRLFKAALDNGAKVHVSTPAKALVVDGGRVIGVEAEKDGKPYFVRARHGVFMGTGGYSHNPELLKAWMQRPIEYTCEVETSTGDGHLMGLAIGAQMAHLGDAWFMPAIPPEDWSVFGHSRGERALPHTLIINRRGKRFVNEPLNYYDFGDAWGTKQDGPRNLPAWLIFDSQAVAKYRTFDGFAKTRPGTRGFAMADSPDELASKLGIEPASNLRETLERFSAYAAKGEDPDFGRGQNPWDIRWGDPNNQPNASLGTVEKGPFYAVEMRPGALGTKGGLKINARAEVISALNGKPIPGLYAGGNCASSPTPGAYGGPGGTLGACLTFGYLAGLELGAAARAAKTGASALARAK